MIRDQPASGGGVYFPRGYFPGCYLTGYFSQGNFARGHFLERVIFRGNFIRGYFLGEEVTLTHQHNYCVFFFSFKS